MLSALELKEFVEKGFLKVPHAVPRNICEEVCETLWKDLPVDRNDRSTWTKPVIRLNSYSGPPFETAANMPVLLEAFDQLAGPGNWIPLGGLGTFPVRFPSDEEPGDTGWHVDASFSGDSKDFLSWRVNRYSKGRALLMLFLFSDIGIDDAPTRILAGSHRHVAQILSPYGEQGLDFMELAKKLEQLPQLDEIRATGEAGTVYLCHPFLAHAAMKHSGRNPRFLAQPPLQLKEPFLLKNKPEDCYPVERAIVEALY